MEKLSFLKLFVYGTLKRGYWNHDAYCGGFETVEKTTVPGRLFRRHTGTPILDIAREGILAVGTDDVSRDIAKQSRAEHEHMPEDKHSKGEWLQVEGELFTYRDAAERLRRLDELEQYTPGSDDTLYDRVLIRLGPGREHVAWVYIIPENKSAEYYRPAVNPECWEPRVELDKERLRALGYI